MVEKTKQLHDEILGIYNMVCGVMMEITVPLKNKSASNEDMCDVGYLCREMENMLNEMRKEVKVRKELCGRLIAYNRVKDAMTDPSIDMKVSGSIATGTPDVKMQTALPKKGSPEYLKFCDYLGVPKSVAEEGVLKLDWNGVTEFCTQQLADGRNIPRGLGKQYPQYLQLIERRFKMAKKNRTDSAITKINPNFLEAYIEEDDSLDALKDHRVLPRIKLIQGTTDQEMKKLFGEGSAVLRPGDALICKYDEEPNSFQIVPVFFFVEYAKWACIDAPGPMVLERSFDPVGSLAKKAKNRDLREELYEGHDKLPEKEQFKYRYVEHLRFISLIYGDHPLAGTPMTVSFERGEYGQGKNFISAISLRRQVINDKFVQVPLWAQVWELSPGHRAPDKTKKWYGFDFIAADPAIINAEEAPAMKALHLEMKELFKRQRLIVDDEPVEDPTIETDPEKTDY